MGWRCRGEKIELADHEKAVTGMGMLKRFEELSIPRGPNDEAWLDRSDHAQKALGLFQASVREYHQERKRSSKRVTAEDVISDMEILQADMHPEHLATVEIEQEKALARIAGRASAAAKSAPMRDPVPTQQVPGDELEGLPFEARSKLKMRPEQPYLAIKDEDLFIRCEGSKINGIGERVNI